MTRLLRIIEILAITALCLLVVFAVVALSVLLVGVIHSSTHGASLMNSLLLFCALVGCVFLSMALGHGISETRRGK